MIRIIYFSLFESCLRNGIIFWGRDRDSNSIFKLQKQVLRVIYGVSSLTSCRQIFKDYNVLTLPSLYILEVICFIKKQKVFMVKNSDIHNYNTRRKLNMVISLYSKVPDQIILREIFNSFKKELKSLLLKHSYSVDEFISSEF
jgi:hypothetical protein